MGAIWASSIGEIRRLLGTGQTTEGEERKIINYAKVFILMRIIRTSPFLQNKAHIDNLIVIHEAIFYLSFGNHQKLIVIKTSLFRYIKKRKRAMI